MYLCWFSSSAKHVALLLLMFSWKAFLLYVRSVRTSFPFFVSWAKKRVSNFCNADFATNYTLWPWQTKVKNCSRKAQFPIESETSKSQRNLFNVNKKLQKKRMRKEKKVSFLSTISYSNVHLTRVINYMDLEFLYHKRRSRQDRGI